MILCHKITEMLVVERTIWSHPLQVRMPSGSRIMFRWIFKIFSSLDCTTSWSKLCQGSAILTVKSSFWHSEWTSCVSVCARCLWFCHWALWKEPGSMLCASSFQVFICMMWSLLTLLLQDEQSLLSHPFLLGEMLQFLYYLSSLLLRILSGAHWGGQSCTQDSRCGLHTTVGRITSHSAGKTLPNAAQNAIFVAFFATSTGLWFILIWCSSGQPAVFLHKIG